MGRLRVLVVDDQADVRLGLRTLIETLGAEVREAESGEQALDVLAQWIPHVMVADIEMGALSGLDLLVRVRERRPEIRVLMVTGFGTIERAVEAMRHGAANFLTKPFDNAEILDEVERLGQEALVAERVRKLRSGTDRGGPVLIAEDPRMAAVLELVQRVAPTQVPVLIRGESGSGKELVARALHQHSRDPALPFLAVNSAALPETLLESELFGYRKGAFTGADRDREGIFAQARGGTVFLDEIALMPLSFQGKLMRVLQEHTVTPLGSATSRPVAFRLVVATNRSLRERIADGSFREDLYYRICVATIDVPPLRERPADILPLALHFLATYSREMRLGRTPSLSAVARAALLRHPWPGNVRELENAVQRALVLCRDGDIGVEHLRLGEEGESHAGGIPEDRSYEAGKQKVLEDYQRKAVDRALRASHGNVTRAAEICGLTRAAFQRLMRRLGIEAHGSRSKDA
jgi:DNA-binding NtrC family response regulator